MPYTDASSQTIIAGLTKHPSKIPPALIPTNTTTPPDDMPSKTPHKPPSATKLSPTTTYKPTTKPARPRLKARISLPTSELRQERDDDPFSPPPTQALLSPLPEANRLHAGHTPLIPMALSPKHQGPSGELTPVEMVGGPEPEMESMSPEEVVEAVLNGPLTLPSLPTDGAADRIELKVLDAVLEKVAAEQGSGVEDVEEEEQRERDEVPPLPLETAIGERMSRTTSGGSERRASEFDFVDGVLLKKPSMNFGAPLGQL